MPRLFTGLEIPSNAATELSLLRGGLSGARWIEPEDYHLTLRFVGDVGRELANEIADRLDDIRAKPFEITLEHLAVFGADKPRALIARAVDTTPLMELQAEHERMMQRIGLAAEGRRFTPHVTLARLRDASVLEVADYLSTRGGFPALQFPVSRFVLYSSRASQGGGPYVVEADYPLRGRAGLESRYASAM